jgi:hypothetical protein
MSFANKYMEVYWLRRTGTTTMPGSIQYLAIRVEWHELQRILLQIGFYFV